MEEEVLGRRVLLKQKDFRFNYQGLISEPHKWCLSLSASDQFRVRSRNIKKQKK